MINIIKQGTRPSRTTIYKKTCACCGCEFEFDWDAIRECVDSATTYEAMISCPCCGDRTPVKPHDEYIRGE